MMAYVLKDIEQLYTLQATGLEKGLMQSGTGPGEDMAEVGKKTENILPL